MGSGLEELKGELTMWLYNEDYCEGVLCCKNCDECSVAERMLESEEEE
jgi:hypothetical protein